VLYEDGQLVWRDDQFGQRPDGSVHLPVLYIRHETISSTDTGPKPVFFRAPSRHWLCVFSGVRTDSTDFSLAPVLQRMFVFAVPCARLSCMVAHAQVPTFVQRPGIPHRHHDHTTLIFSWWHLTTFRMWCGCCVATQHRNPHSGGATSVRARSNDLTWLEDFLTSKWPGAQFTKYLTIYRKFIVRSTYDSDFKSAKISSRNIVGLY